VDGVTLVGMEGIHGVSLVANLPTKKDKPSTGLPARVQTCEVTDLQVHGVYDLAISNDLE